MLYLRKDTWWYDFTIGGKRYRGTTGFGKDQKKEAKKAEEQAKQNFRENNSVELIWTQTKKQLLANKEIAFDYNKIWQTFVKSGTSKASPHRMNIYANRLGNFCDWMKEHYPDVVRISQVLGIHAREWMNEIRSQDGSNGTKNDYLTAMKLIFSSLGKDYGVIENPFADIKKLKNDIVMRSAFTPEELKLIGQHATGWKYSLSLTAISTGLREGDICLLKKSSVDLHSGWISIQKTNKTHASVEIPILPGLARHLNEVLEEETDSEYVFPVLADMYMNDPSKIGKGIKELFKEIGIENSVREIDGYKKRLSMKDVHSFRHTFVYLAAVHQIPFPIVQGIVGHMSPEMTKHYMNHAGRNDKAQFLNQLPDYLTEQKTKRKHDEVLKTMFKDDYLIEKIRNLSKENLEQEKQRIIDWILLTQK